MGEGKGHCIILPCRNRVQVTVFHTFLHLLNAERKCWEVFTEGLQHGRHEYSTRFAWDQVEVDIVGWLLQFVNVVLWL